MAAIHSEIVDILILGGGPTGLFAAFYAGLRNSSCKIVDSLPALGGRLMAVYPEKYIYDVPGFSKILAQDLVNHLVHQAKSYSPSICLNEVAQSLVLHPEGFFELATDKTSHFARSILIAAGVGSYSPKKHSAPGAARLEGCGVVYSVIDKSIYAGLDVLVVGGGDSALDWAFELSALARSVTLVHRSEKFRAHEASVDRLRSSSINVILNTEISEFHGDSKLSSVTLNNLDNQTQTSIDCQVAVVMFGFNSSLGAIRDWGLLFSNDGILVNNKMETNLPGVYAAGDIADYEGKLKLIVTGFSEATTAINFAKNYLYPKEKVQPIHSTTLMELKEKREARQKGL